MAAAKIPVYKVANLVDIFVPEEVEVSLEISVAQGTNGRDANRSWTIRSLGGPSEHIFA